MRVLIDECLNWRLGRALTGHYAVLALLPSLKPGQVVRISA
jgi:hypothetical protein